MRKKGITLLVALCFWSCIMHSQTWLWGMDGKGSFGTNSFGSTVAIDKYGNAYMTGSFQDSIHFGGYAFGTPAPASETYVVKYNSSGM
jgi:hypothetical protein